MDRYPQIKLANPKTFYGRWFNKLFDTLISPLMQLRIFQRAYAKSLLDFSKGDLWTKILRELKITLFMSEDDLMRIPKTGPLIIVVNHPHGIMDGVLLGSLIHRVRDDFKIIMNEASVMPGLDDYLLFVAILGTPKENAKKNMQNMREALSWLKAGHVIALFPAGEISAISQADEKIALDNTWSTNVIRLSVRAKAPVLPLFIVGQNDRFFLKSGLIHPLFRTLQIGRVTNHLLGKTLTMRAAYPIAPKVLSLIQGEKSQTNFIRAYLYALMARQTQQHRVPAVPLEVVNNTLVTEQRVCQLYDLLLKQSNFLIRENSTYTVLLCSQQQLLDLGQPYSESFSVLKDEIGRLRELTFREIGEGSGQARDLDQFDEYYSHLTLWDREQKQIIGAYRIAFTEDIFPQYGVLGLYTATQFDYHPDFFTTMGPAMELSRAFIIKAHQKNHLSLSTLLGALSEMLRLRPSTLSFFGAVSISNAFQSISKKLIMAYLTRHHGQNTLTPLVKPKNPPLLETYLPDKEWQRLLDTVQDLSLLNTVVSAIETDGKGVPPLFSAYISLMGRFVAFDEDYGFNSIDGLLVMDMQAAALQNNPMMRRLMGKASFDAYKNSLSHEVSIQ